MSVAKNDSGRSFQEAWTKLLRMIEHNWKALRMLCTESAVCHTSSDILTPTTKVLPNPVKLTKKSFLK